MYFLLEDKPLKDYLQAYEKKDKEDIFFGNINVTKAFDVAMMNGKEKKQQFPPK